ncbi:cytochrome c [Hydrogenophaga sp.]|jgi:cytochrome c553|uniref:c-type cytochrome n=2 Tax=Hydrogenophaga sp. TaxID=1904254 RepID=UPI00271FE2D9|nr:c-type cytochrome [Hydrogenophaga sp.]MBU4519113.1 cytochrome c4 [Gammaproteobacteria bacterium]MDZ4361318.1 c-type cytochrome [Variovorax sp.]MBV1734138.1 cytochrome c4 [Hydrogenophaga sp.]MDO9132040.1 c-type cytochrome [Hydrogenophaga sp.]MDP2408089.1 c-type cytochrome [Hydrogenophaga sp.]
MNQLLPMIARSLVAAATFSAVALTAQAQGLTGNADAGQKKADMCIGCHGIPGYQNSFPEIHKVPKISGQSDKYIVAALTAYKSGERKHPSMRGIAASLSEQDMADLGAFYASHASKTATETPKAANEVTLALIEKGACASCHGANFSKPIDPSYPKIGGQHADYLFVALKAYTVEGNSVVGRANPIMAGMAKQYTPAEMRQIAKYLASLDGELSVVPQSRFR